MLKASEALHIGCIRNITKPLWILYQLSKLFLNFWLGRKSVTTLPHTYVLTYYIYSKEGGEIVAWFEPYYVCVLRNNSYNSYRSISGPRVVGKRVEKLQS